ncbi:hypothetical protein Trydic_g18479 [Trypoxylus dichotomus]
MNHEGDAETLVNDRDPFCSRGRISGTESGVGYRWQRDEGSLEAVEGSACWQNSKCQLYTGDHRAINAGLTRNAKLFT